MISGLASPRIFPTLYTEHIYMTHKHGEDAEKVKARQIAVACDRGDHL